MRRVKAKEIDKSKEKQKRDVLVRSIAVEQSVKTSLASEIKELKKLVNDLRTEVKEEEDNIAVAKANTKKYKSAEVTAFDSMRAAQAKVIEHETKAKELRSIIQSLEASISETRNSHMNEHAITIAVRNRENEEHAQHITNLRSQIIDMEGRVATLKKIENDITRSIEDRKLEQTGLEHTLQFRLQELSRVNMSVDTTKSEYERTREEYELWGKRLESIKSEFSRIDNEVFTKTEEVKTKEREVENAREKLVALMVREKKIDERADTIRDLFERAGLNIKL